MRMGALAAQFLALFHTEAMLFIDHNKLQILELDRPFDDRMGTDHDLHRTIGKPSADRFLVTFRSVAHQQTDLTLLKESILTSKQLYEISIVLFCQDRGGRHDGGLCATVDYNCSG